MSLTSELDYSAVPSSDYMVGSVKDFVSPKEWSELMQFYRKPCHYDSLDTIHITVDDCERIMEGLTHTYTLKQIFDQPSLWSFTAILTDDGEEIQLCFRPSRLLGHNFKMSTLAGAKNQSTPQVDVYVSYDCGATTAFIFTIGRGLDAENHEFLFMAPLWAHPDTDGSVPRGMSVFSNVYPVLQSAMYERPTIFITDEERTVSIAPPQHKNPHKRNRQPKPNKVRIARVIHVDTQKLPKGTRTITCPSWGVIGHFRHYKSGKVIWVDGYTKGRERHNPDSYQPKEYQLASDPSQE